MSRPKRRMTLASLTLAATCVVWVGTVTGPVAGETAAQPVNGGITAQQPSPACDPQPVVGLGDEPYFTDISAASGIQDENFDPDTPVGNNDHSRLAFVDLNGDGYDDIVTSNMTGDVDAKPFEHLIYLNNHDGTFANFSDASGLRDVQSAFFAFGDVDGDGDQDAFAGVDPQGVRARGIPNQLLLNDGDGHFTFKHDSGLEAQSGVAWAGNAVFADFNGDGNLDLYVGNGATAFLTSDELFFGHGDGTFVDVTDRLKGAPRRKSNGSVACDYDNDGDLDIFVSVYGVSTELGHNLLWENDGAGNFTNVARERGFEALATGNYFLTSTGMGRDAEPVPQDQWVGGNGFGLSCDDINNDGLMDIWIADISHAVSSDYSRKWSDPTQLLINQGPDAGYSFKNVYLDAGIPFNEGDLEASAADFDNDGRVDLGVSRENKYEGNFTKEPQKGWFGLFHQLADGTFEDVSFTSGVNDLDDPAPIPKLKAGHSNVWSDIEHDGDLDLLVGGVDKTSHGRPNFLLRNDIGSRNAWLDVRLDGSGGDFNRDAIGARVQLLYPDRIMTHELKSSRGMYDSSDTRVLHFGLGNLGCATTIRVKWPNGEVFNFDGSAFGQNASVTLRYGEGHRVSPVYLPDVANAAVLRGPAQP